MLSKKILHLKKKIENCYDNVMLVDFLLKENNDLKDSIELLNKKILSLSEEIENIKSIKANHFNISSRIEKIENYNDMCSKDIPIMANAISEIYNLLNVLFSGSLIINKSNEEEDIFYEDFDEGESELEIYSLENKKKKKVYH